MQNIVELASTYKLDVEMRAFAHYVSSNDHRRKGVRWGVAAAILGGAAGLSTLAGASRLDSLKDALSHFGVSWSVFLVVLGVVFLISSIVSGVMHFLQHPEQARTHMASYAGYFRIKQRLEIFRLWYDDRNGTSPDKVQGFERSRGDLQGY